MQSKNNTDKGLGFYWFSQSASQGNSLAQFELALCYFNGTGVAFDSKKGVFWVEKSANQELASTQFYIGSLYSRGKYLPKDES